MQKGKPQNHLTARQATHNAPKNIIVHFTTRGHLYFKISRFISDIA